MNVQIPASKRFLSLMQHQVWIALFLCLVSSARAQGDANAIATFQHVELLADQTNDGLHGIAVKFDLGIKPAPSSTPVAPLVIIATVLDDNKQPLFAASNAQGYVDALGYCRDSLVIPWPTTEAAPAEMALFVPYFALGLPAGPNRVQIRLQLINQQTKQVLASAAPLDLRFTKPPLKLYRMRVDRIVAYTTDTDGETWDYKFLNARDIYPELMWSLRRGHYEVFESPKQKNDTIFIGGEGDQSPWLWLSEGDRIHFFVRDFDLLGFNDLVGSLGIDIWQGGFLAGQVHEVKFERVRQALVMQEALSPPKVSITNYEVIEHDQQAGLTGTRIKLEYQVTAAVPAARFVLEPRLRGNLGSFVPQVVQIIGPGAVPLSPGLVELTANQSTLELFIPHFAMPEKLPPGAMMQVEAGLLLGQQGFVLTRQQRQLMEVDVRITDMVYGQWKVGVHDIAGRGGLRMTLDYALPAAYFEGLDQAKITLEPRFQATWGAIPSNALEMIGGESADWDGTRLLLSRANREGSLDLFLPFSAFPPGSGPVAVTANYETNIDFGGRIMSLGAIARQSQVEIPTLEKLTLGLREAAVGRTAWILNHPSMYWELHCGGKLLHRSHVVPDLRTAHWAEADAHTWVVSEHDRIELRVYHQVTDGLPDRLLEMWTGEMSELPNRDRGNVRLPTKDLKRMVLHIDYVETEKQDDRPRNTREH